MIANLRIALVFLIVGLTTALLLPVQYLAVKFNWSIAKKIPVIWHRVVAKSIGIKVDVFGTLTKDRPLLVVANHVSWLDIVILGGIAELSFIAKNEVDDMPGANLLARMQRTIFVVRENKREVAKQAKEVTERLLANDAMVLFAEGTTGDGQGVLEFKSSLFGATQFALKSGKVDDMFVQPVCITYNRLHGMPIGRIGRTAAAWPGDVELKPHFMKILRHSAWDVEVHIADTIKVDETSGRKFIASYSRTKIREMFIRSNHRPTP